MPWHLLPAVLLLVGGWWVGVASGSARKGAARPVAQTVAGIAFAQGALDVLLADLQQEIVQGSTGTAAGSTTIYQPLSPANMLPVRSGNPEFGGGSADPVPNLIRRSVRAEVIAAPGVPSLASAVNSAGDPALNGSAVTPARWNLHYLLPRYDAEGTPDAAATTPDAAARFTAPDWVLVTRNGPAVQTGIGSGEGALNNPDPANGNYVVGRYAFAMYDEGGLLDMNAAGYPTPSAPAAPNGFTATQVGYKTLLSFADLTRLPVVKNPASASDYLAQKNVDRLVGWRNYASARPLGTFPDYTFDAAASARYYNAALANRTGFLSVDPSVQFNGQTDQLFTSRQQLIGLCDAFGISRNALQYLTTYSRALEQPSFVPAHIANPATAPSINAVSSTLPPAAALANNYQGNNDAAGSAGDTSGQDLINPALLTVRVAQFFTRADGSTAAVGEPLVKRKFALSRLAEVSYQAADTTPSATDPTLTNGNHVKEWFGLSRATAAAPWTYNHGAARILTLAQVAAANREPDFAELLKAAINVGSIAKGGPNLNVYTGSVINYQYTLDVSVDRQVLQIMANLIDQYDADSYPTVIQMATATVRGVEDLPYFYRCHPMSVVTRLPVPLLNKNHTVNFSSTGGSSSVTMSPCEPLPSGGLQDPGNAVALYVPELWNPADANSPTLTTGRRPARFRISVMTGDPAGQTVPWQIGASARTSSSYSNVIPPMAVIPSKTAPLADNTTAFIFSDDGGKLFREPTLLWRADAPTNVNIVPEPGSLGGPYTDANTQVSYYGLQIGQSPVSYVGAVSRASYPASPQASDDNYLFQTSNIVTIANVPAGAYQQCTFRLQYLDPVSGGWITYDEKYPDLRGLVQPRLVVNKADYTNNAWQNPVRTFQLLDVATCYDPRTARFGVGIGGLINNASIPVLEPAAAANYAVNTADGNAAFAASRFTVFGTHRPGSDRGGQANYCLPGLTSDPGKNQQMRWFSGVGYNASGVNQGTSPLFYDGLLSQNNPAINIPARDGSNPAQLYYEDADGVARRAMGAYATTSVPTSASTANLEGLPLAIADTYPAGNYGVGVPTAQSQSRPLLLNRPFRNVAEMSYAFTGTPWKQLDLFTPESGDAALLDAFCLTEPPPAALVAGKVNLNTRQTPVLKAILAGAYRDEVNNLASPTVYALPALNGEEASAAANKLVGITTDSTHAWRGPLSNVAELVGLFIPNPGDTSGASDMYRFTETITGSTYTYAGLSAALDGSVYTANNAPAGYKVQRMREAAIRPLASAGQTRVWNILIDLVAQSGSYPAEAATLADFAVTEENHCWLHVAIDRFTGQVLDQSIEPVYEGVTGLALDNASVCEGQPAGTPVGKLTATAANTADAITYRLVAGDGDDDNAAFALSGNTLVTATTFQYLNKASCHVRVRAVNPAGQGYERTFTIAVQATPYNAWKAANFGASANDPSVSGDLADPDGDGLANLLEYALGTSPTMGNGSGISVTAGSGTLTMNYTRASAATDVTVQATWSANLAAGPGAWTHDGVEETMLSDDGKTQRWQAVVHVPNNASAFMRLQANIP